MISGDGLFRRHVDWRTSNCHQCGHFWHYICTIKKFNAGDGVLSVGDVYRQLHSHFVIRELDWASTSVVQCDCLLHSICDQLFWPIMDQSKTSLKRCVGSFWIGCDFDWGCNDFTSKEQDAKPLNKQQYYCTSVETLEEQQRESKEHCKNKELELKPSQKEVTIRCFAC
uniref:Uncharacterized protein n=1 Tax=Ditylenchus dipsaci TaxID=166011 RepID=A0A915DSK2_9BILA